MADLESFLSGLLPTDNPFTDLLPTPSTSARPPAQTTPSVSTPTVPRPAPSTAPATTRASPTDPLPTTSESDSASTPALSTFTQAPPSIAETTSAPAISDGPATTPLPLTPTLDPSTSTTFVPPSASTTNPTSQTGRNAASTAAANRSSTPALSTGSIVGMVIGIILVLALLGLVIRWLVRRRKDRNGDLDPDQALFALPSHHTSEASFATHPPTNAAPTITVLAPPPAVSGRMSERRRTKGEPHPFDQYMEDRKRQEAETRRSQGAGVREMFEQQREWARNQGQAPVNAEAGPSYVVANDSRATYQNRVPPPAGNYSVPQQSPASLPAPGEPDIAPSNEGNRYSRMPYQQPGPNRG